MYKKNKEQINIEFHQKIDISQSGCPTNKGNKNRSINEYDELL